MRAMDPFVVGVDGGGSKTRAILADDRGGQIAEAVGDASAVRPGEAERSAGIIAGVVRDVLESAGQDRARPRVLCVGVAGVGRESERGALRQALMAHDLAEEVEVQSDFLIALEDAFGEGPGVLLIAGTGSSAFGRSPAGNSARCGGWGPVIGDEGSGAWIGRRALSVVAAASDGREPETALTGAVLTATECEEASELVRWAAESTPARLAALAPVVVAVADGGDLRANSIVSLAVEDLALHVRALARQLFVDERASVPVALTGGLLRKGSSLRKRLEHRLRTAVPGAQIHAAEVDPARGAVKSALRQLSDSLR
jgi:glucosamine kinase